MFSWIIKTELRCASSNLEVRDFFSPPSSNAEYNLRNVCVACTTCAANSATLTRTDGETSWIIQSIVIIVRWFSMITNYWLIKKTQKSIRSHIIWAERSHDYKRNKEKKSSNEVDGKLVRARRNRWVYEISSDVQDIPKMRMVASWKLDKQKFPQYVSFKKRQYLRTSFS